LIAIHYIIYFEGKKLVLELNKSNLNKFDRLIAEEMAKMKIGGLSYAIIKDGKVAHTQGFGARDLDKNLPADENTIYRIASITKSFICTAIMRLVEEGRLKVTDPVKNYLPLEIGTEDKPITIKHLMNHTSGIPELAEDTFWYYLAREGVKIPPNTKLIPMSSENDFFRLINGAGEFYHELDQYFHYNNYGYTMLGMIITKVAGKDYREFIKEKIFQPLKMESTSFYPEDFKDNNNLAQGYHVNPADRGGNTRKIGQWENRWERMAPGGIYSCVKDMVAYVLMHINGGTYRDVKIISKESSQEMQRNSLLPGTMAEKVVSNYSVYKSVGYGYGFRTDSNFYGHIVVGHSGGSLGYGSNLLFIPTLNIGIVAMANYMTPIIIEVTSSILALLAGTPEENIHILTEKNHFKKLNGIYEGFNEALDRIKITGESSVLVVQNVDKHEFALPPTVLYPFDKKTLKPMEFYTRMPGGAKLIVFFEEIDGILWFNYESFRFRKIGKI